MKKLMIAASAVLCATVFGLESANIVGYMDNNKTVAGLNLLAPGFVDVGLTSTKLSGLKVTNAEGGEVGTGACGINLIDENGNTLKTYSWESSGRGASKTWGWAENSTAIDDSVVLEAGQAVLFTAQSAGDKLIFPAID